MVFETVVKRVARSPFHRLLAVLTVINGCVQMAQNIARIPEEL